MKFSYRLGILLAVLAGVAVCVLALPQQQEQPEEVARNDDTTDVSTRLGGLLDFARYKKIFNKSYPGLLEEAVRLKYFTANALRIAVVAVKYRFRLVSYYLSLNDMSDWTRNEFERLGNTAFAKWVRSVAPEYSRQPTSPSESSTPEPVPVANENVAQEVRQHVDENKVKPDDEQLGTKATNGDHESRKHEADDEEPLQPRDLPIEKLIHADEAEKSPEGWGEEQVDVPSNNPQLVHAEPTTKGFKEAQLPVEWYSFESPDNPVDDLGVSASAIRASNVDLLHVAQNVGDQPKHETDQVFSDLRETGCIGPVRRQGECSSCYAFATIAIMEFLYCKNTGKEVRFSEQYMLDCGRHVGFDGCGGGNPLFVPNFIRNFGLYPSALYPYQGEEGQCPYDEDSVKLEQTGYIRSDSFANSLMISRELWGKALEHGPLSIGTIAHFGSDFQQYGGGVLMGHCEGPPSHAVVLVGHGRQEGREYWLIRNSWGPKWGEGGYIKVDKECNCVQPDLGLAYGVTRPEHADKVTFFENVANAAEAVSRAIGARDQWKDDANAKPSKKVEK